MSNSLGLFIFIYCWVVLPQLALAQETSQESALPSAAGLSSTEHFDFLKASQLAMRAQKFNGTLFSNPQKSCVPVRGASGESVMSCSVPDSEIDNSVIAKTPEFPEGKIPEAIQAVLPTEFVQDVKNKKVTCVFRFGSWNDNQQFLGCKGQDKVALNGTVRTDDKCGDDWGATHGLSVGLSCTSTDGLSQTFTYSTDLFTDPNRASRRKDSSGVSHMDQKFISENLFSYLQDNINQGHLTYWRRGVGFINLSSKKKWGFLQSTGQQDWFHDMINRKNPGGALNYNYIDGTQDQWGAFVTLATGLQGRKEIGSFCTISGSAEVGARLATLKQSNLIYGSAEGKFGVKVGEGQIYARAAYDLTRRPSSTVGVATLATGYERKKGLRFEFGAKKQNGNRTDVPDSPNLVAQSNRGVKKYDVHVFFETSYGF